MLEKNCSLPQIRQSSLAQIASITRKPKRRSPKFYHSNRLQRKAGAIQIKRFEGSRTPKIFMPSSPEITKETCRDLLFQAAFYRLQLAETCGALQMKQKRRLLKPVFT